MTQRWCGESKFSDGDLVREKKLLLFLQEVVLPMRTVPRTRKSMSQKLDSKRKRNAASKRRKRAKIAQKNGKNVVESNAPPTSCLAEPESDEEDSDSDRGELPESLYSMLLNSSFCFIGSPTVSRHDRIKLYFSSCIPMGRSSC